MCYEINIKRGSGKQFNYMVRFSPTVENGFSDLMSKIQEEIAKDTPPGFQTILDPNPSKLTFSLLILHDYRHREEGVIFNRTIKYDLFVSTLRSETCEIGYTGQKSVKFEDYKLI